MSGSEFNREGFTKLKRLIDTSKLYEYSKELINRPYRTDMQVPNAPSFYNDPEMNRIHDLLLPTIESETNLELYKTYSYMRIYRTGDVLRIHKDRPACEISLTLTLGYEGEMPWPIFIMDKNENPVEINLQAGDGLLYKGCECLHWRPKFEGVTQSQVFLHYVDKNGPFANWKDDKQKPE